MNLSMRAFVSSVSLILCSQLSVAQVTTTLHVQVPVSVKPNPPFFFLSAACPVLGEPYSADSESEHHQMLADGTNIDQNRMDFKAYRDSQGRTRWEHYLSTRMTTNSPVLLIRVEISDPVAGLGYDLDPRKRTARKFTLQPNRCGERNTSSPPVSLPVLPRQPDTVVPCGNPKSKQVVEDLGTQSMDGLVVHGTRTTTTIPTCAQANDRPFTIVSELWVSDEMKLNVLSKHLDPRYGESTIRLKDFQRCEPDISLFQVPPDYTIVQ